MNPSLPAVEHISHDCLQCLHQTCVGANPANVYIPASKHCQAIPSVVALLDPSRYWFIQGCTSNILPADAKFKPAVYSMLCMYARLCCHQRHGLHSCNVCKSSSALCAGSAFHLHAQHVTLQLICTCVKPADRRFFLGACISIS